MKFKNKNTDPKKTVKPDQITSLLPTPPRQPQKPHAKVIFCIPGREFTANFLQSWTKLLNTLYLNNISFILSNTYSPVVYYARTGCLRGHVLRGRDQAPFNDEVDYDYIMWIDSDIVFEPQDFFALLQRMEQNKHIDVLSGVYLMADGHHTTCVDKWDEDFFEKNGSFKFMTKPDMQTKAMEPETVKNGGIFECVYIGMGWLMVRKGVHERIQYPFFKPQFHELQNGIYDFSSEDASFFLELKEKGVKCYVDPNVNVGHEKMCVLK